MKERNIGIYSVANMFNKIGKLVYIITAREDLFMEIIFFKYCIPVLINFFWYMSLQIELEEGAKRFVFPY